MIIGCELTYCDFRVGLKHNGDFISFVDDVYPSKHGTLKQCWSNVGPPSATLAQHYTSIVWMCRVCWHDTLRWCIACKPHYKLCKLLSHCLGWNTTLYRKWNEWGFRPPLCTYRLNWARRTSWRWWDEWDHFHRDTIVAFNFNQRRVFFADFSVNSKSISMKFCKHSLQVFRRLPWKFREWSW